MKANWQSFMEQAIEDARTDICKADIVIHRDKCACPCKGLEVQSVTFQFIGAGETLPLMELRCVYCGRVIRPIYVQDILKEHSNDS